VFKRSKSADTGDYKYATPEIAYSESSKAKYPSPDKKNQPAMIGTSIRVEGELSGDEDIVIQRHVEGTIELKRNDLTVNSQGFIKADGRAKIIVVEGKMEGDL
jgi:cytoskeletal protein CcmA (bactofilin family)